MSPIHHRACCCSFHRVALENTQAAYTIKVANLGGVKSVELHQVRIALCSPACAACAGRASLPATMSPQISGCSLACMEVQAPAGQKGDLVAVLYGPVGIDGSEVSAAQREKHITEPLRTR